MSWEADNPPPFLKGRETMIYRVLRIDPRSVPVEAVTFAGDTLTINLPQRTYNSGLPYFLRLSEPIPDTATVGAGVMVTIGDGTVEYPLLDLSGVQVTAERLRSGYSYPVAVVGSGANGAFKVLAPLVYSKCPAVFSIDGTAPEGGAA